MLLVFVLDTSASMCQRVPSGMTLLDCAKSAIEHFLKVRQRDISSRGDRYMLVTCEEGDNAIKVLDRHPFANFLRMVKSTQARDLSSLGASMQRIFNFLQMQLLAAEIDRFGHGRNPCSIEPTLVMLLTDGTELTSLAGVTTTIMLPGGPVPVGSDLALQPFRWDQRVFAAILRIPSSSASALEQCGPLLQRGPVSGKPAAAIIDSNISAFCEVTGGKCVVLTSSKVLLQHMEAMALQLQPCVVVSLERMRSGAIADLSAKTLAGGQHQLLVKMGQSQGQGHWPIPESYWPDPSQPGLPPREAHPKIAFRAVDARPNMPASFTADKYEVESSSLDTLMKVPAGACWHCYVYNSKGTSHGYGDPFGYLRLNRGGTGLLLFVLPYNFPVLWGLLDQLPRIREKTLPDVTWRGAFERYCAGVPPYYANPLRAALRKWGLSPSLVPESMDRLSSSYAAAHLKRIRAHAKGEVDRELARLAAQQRAYYSHGLPSILPRSRAFPLPPPSFHTLSGEPAHPASAGDPDVEVIPRAHSLQALGNPTSGGLQPAWKNLDLLVPCSPSQTGHGLRMGLLPSAGSPTAPAVAAADWRGPQRASYDRDVFSNPFDHQVEDVQRLLLFLPIHVAAALEARSRRSVEHHTQPLKWSPGNCTARLAAEAEDNAKHTVLIEKMGDFNEVLLRQQMLRNHMVDDSERNKQRAAFGNPYRQDRQEGLGPVEEAWLEGAKLKGLMPRPRRREKSRSPSPSAAPFLPRGQPSSISTKPQSITKALMGSATASISPQLLGESESCCPSTDKQGASLIQVTQAGGQPVEGLLDVERASAASRQPAMGDESLGTTSDLLVAASAAELTALVHARSQPPGSSRGGSHAEEQGPAQQLQAGHRQGTGKDYSSTLGPVSTQSSAASKEEQQGKRRGRGLQNREAEMTDLVTLARSASNHGQSTQTVDFLVLLFRVLRASQGTEGLEPQLSALLETAVLPLDRTGLLQQLLRRARRHKKHRIAADLSACLNQALSAV